nr:hypothetical protein [uncultured Draconibacterium sp.]
MMENAKTFLISKLRELVDANPELEVHYKFDALSKEHLVKTKILDPEKGGSFWEDFEEEMIFYFIDNHPFENLVFVSENSWIDIPEPELIIKNENFGNFSIKNREEILFNVEDYELISFKNLDEDYLVSIEGILDNLSGALTIDNNALVISNILEESFYGTETIQVYCRHNQDFYKQAIPDESEIYPDNCGCDNFALAA